MARWSGFDSIARTFGQRNFRVYLGGSFVSLIGTWTQRIAVGWLTWELTESFTWLGIMAAAEFLPTVVISPVAGALADRMDRKRLAILGQTAAAAQAAALAALTFAGLMTVWVLLGFTILLGAVYATSTAARLSIFPSLVERPFLSSAIAINAAGFNLARFIGPAVGGAIIARFGVTAAFALNTLTFLGFIWALTRLTVAGSETAGRERTGLFADVKEGLAYALGHPGIGPALVLLTACALGVKGFPELLPGFVDTVFRRGVEAFAQLTAAAGIGAACAAIWVAQRGRVAGLTGVSQGALLASALAIFGFVATDIFPVALVGVMAAGAAITIVGTATQSLMQNAVAGEMRGRVMSLYGVIFRGGPAIGAVTMGAAAEWIGLRLTLTGAAMIAVAAWLWLLGRRRVMVRTLEGEPPGPAPAASAR